MPSKQILEDSTTESYDVTTSYDDILSSTENVTSVYYDDDVTSTNEALLTIFANATDQPTLDNTSGAYYMEGTTEEYYDYTELVFPIYDFEVYLLGYVWPCLVFLTILTNIVVIAYFLTLKNRLKATNILFVGIAISDTMTCVSLLPNSIYVYAMENDLISETWCKAYMLLRLYVSPVFHTISVWQTVLLSFQRYTCVCHPFISSRICTPTITLVAIALTTVFSMALHTYHPLNDKTFHAHCGWIVESGCTKTCVYLWFSIVLQHLLPCILLSILTTRTIIELISATKRVSITLPRVDAKRTSRDKVITIASALIVIVFLFPELPHGIYKLLIVIRHTDQTNANSDSVSYHIVICIYELLMVLTFFANFWIYYGMMKDFRIFFLQLITCGHLRRSLKRVKSTSSNRSRNGSVMTNVSRTSSLAGRNRVLSNTTTLLSTSSDTAHALMQLTPVTNGGPPKFPVSENFHLTELKSEENNDDVFL